MKYDEPGTYEINLTATDDCGNSATAVREVVVEAPQSGVVIIDGQYAAFNNVSIDFLPDSPYVEVGDTLKFEVTNWSSNGSTPISFEKTAVMSSEGIVTFEEQGVLFIFGEWLENQYTFVTSYIPGHSAPSSVEHFKVTLYKEG